MALDDPVVWIFLFIIIFVVIIVWAARRSGRRKQESRIKTASEYPHYPPPLHTSETKIIEREVLRIPCKYCKSLINPVQDKKCTSCGAPVL